MMILGADLVDFYKCGGHLHALGAVPYFADVAPRVV